MKSGWHMHACEIVHAMAIKHYIALAFFGMYHLDQTDCYTLQKTIVIITALLHTHDSSLVSFHNGQTP